MLNTFLRIFIFTFLFWILLCSDHLDSCKCLNYKNNIEQASYQGTKRSLAESKNMKDPKKENPRTCLKDELKYNQDDITENPLQLVMKQRIFQEQVEDDIEKIDDKNDIELGNTREKGDALKNINYKEILGMFKSNKRLAALSGIFFFPFISFILILVSIIRTYLGLFPYSQISYTSILLLGLAIMLTSLFLIHK